jgi:type IV fimbrial biogenesis protein FimT
MKKAPIQVSARRARHRSAGFTLLELMIATTVLAIGISIAVPSFTDIIRRNRLTTQTNGLMSALAIARSEAVKRGTPVTVCPVEALTDEGADQCSGEDNWAENGWIIFSDVRAPLGEVNAEVLEEANTNDSILQRVPPASEQKIQIANTELMTALTYRQDGTVDLPPGTVTTFTLTPETCRNPDGAREVEVIAAGRAGIKKAQCIAR